MKVSATLAETTTPSDDTLRILREQVDPLGIRRLEFVPANERQKLLSECIKAEEGLIARALRCE